MSNHCFTYGSLMCESIMTAVTGTHHAYQPALLKGYRRGPVRGETYPGMVPLEGAQVEGVLYLDVSDEGCARLDDFEGDEYRRVAVQVSLAGGSVLPAWAYELKPEYAHRLAAEDWDFEEFLRTGKARFEAMYLADK